MFLNPRRKSVQQNEQFLRKIQKSGGLFLNQEVLFLDQAKLFQVTPQKACLLNFIKRFQFVKRSLIKG
jgi:hypothetical protein